VLWQNVAMPGCPSENELLALVQGRLPRDRQREIQDHLDDCVHCQRALCGAAFALDERALTPSSSPSDSAEMVLEATAPAVDPGRSLPQGARMGRYVILEPVGRGAMGTVYAAYDPHLGRKVALKLLHGARAGGERLDELRLRLLREAQAMAKLSDPNVVAVHDVGSHQGDLFVAMDFIQGMNLRAWLEERSRSWRDVLDRFLQAGRGLAAAHRAGIIHRDFKPENVLIRAADGRVCVTDFGLARTLETPANEADPSLATGSALMGSVTLSGVVVGTPAYMAPELFSGGAADTRADLFAFCVALYEALYGERPFPGRSVAEIEAAIRAGDIRRPREGTKVPAWIRRALVAGLRPEPERRPPSMNALLHLLAPRRALHRVVLLALLAVLGGLAFLLYRAAERRAELCRGGERRLAGIWDSPRRGQVHAAFLGTGRAHAADAWSRVSPVLEGYARGWVSAHRSACEATHVHGEQSEATLDLRMQCLERRLRGFSMLLEVFERADAKTTAEALAAAHGLDDFAGCADPQRLVQVPEPIHPETRARVETVRLHLARGRALRDAGHPKDALAEIEAVVPAARGLSHKPVEAEALFLLGTIWFALRDNKKAEALFHEAAVAADASRYDELAAQAKIQLASSVGNQMRLDEALRWAEQAGAAIARIGGNPRREADLLLAKGSAFGHMDRAEEAIDCLSRGLEIFETKLDPDHPKIVVIMKNMGWALSKVRRHTEALRWLTRALSRGEAIHGPHHPMVGAVCLNLGITLRDLGRLEEARDMLSRVLRIYEQHHGPDSLMVARTLISVGVVASDLGRYQECADAQRRALAIQEKKLGRDDPILVSSLNNLALALIQLGRAEESLEFSSRALRILQAKTPKRSPPWRYSLHTRALALERLHRLDEALATYEQGLAVTEKALGPGHPDAAWPLDGIGRVLTAKGLFADALRFHVRALGLHEKAHGGKHQVLVRTLTGIARSRLALGERAAARAALERAVAIGKGVRGEARSFAEASLLLAGVEWRGDRARGRSLAEGAAAALRQAATPDPGLRAQIDRWLATHPRR
jgi:tetratricopeptide (TPR) repeat protein/tRNA A-37 threonylcarbamoyl transferase component Bud32